MSCSLLDQRIRSDSRPVTIDGEFSDWDGLTPVAGDSLNDAPIEEVDFGMLWVANDQKALYLRFEVGRETIWQNEARLLAGNDIRLYLDTDTDVTTGTRIGMLGVDCEIHLGSRFALLHQGSSTSTLSLNDVGLTVGPSHSATQFELRIPFDLQSGGGRIFSEPKFGLLIVEASGGDKFPDQGAFICDMAEGKVAPPRSLTLDREDAGDLRVLSHNIQYNSPVENPEPFRRYLKALHPDVINFQEVWIWDAEETKRFVVETLDPGNALNWHVAKVEDCVTVSRWPIQDTAAVDGNLLCRIGVPHKESSRGLVLFNAHTPCCGNNEGRDYEHDHLASILRDLVKGRGPFPTEPNDGVLLLGDFNLVGFVRQLVSLRDGDIFDNEVFGEDFQPDRLAGSLTVAPLRHTHSRAAYSWRNDSEHYPPGRLDFILFGSGTLQLKNNFTLYTMDIPRDVLEMKNLQRNDSLVSDHLVLIADFEYR
jgi:hypothetical protein